MHHNVGRSADPALWFSATTNAAARSNCPRVSFGGMERFYEQAFDTLTSPKVAKAFDYQGEPETIREKYGKGHRGACYLMGRKLIEAGVRLVTTGRYLPGKADSEVPP